MNKQPTFLIIGGGSGIGADIAKKCAAENCQIAIMSSSGKGEALAKELGGFGYTGSNLNDADIAKFVQQSVEKFGTIDGVMNCAGHGPKGDISEISDQDWHLGMDYYFMNVVRLTRHIVPVMLKQSSGSIVNISTFATFEPDPDFPTSAVFRASLATYTKLFTDKYAKDNIRMNNILPGFIDSLPEKPDRLARIPMGRYAKVRELSEVAYFLLSDASSYMTGQNLRVDGGLTRSV